MTFNFIDPHPEPQLNQIHPVSERALSWLARASRTSGFPQERSVQIAGAVKMLAGLDYHHGNFIQHVAQLEPYWKRLDGIRKYFKERHGEKNGPLYWITDSERLMLDGLTHEAFAYISRLGQYYAFAKALRLHSLLPRAAELMVFRHKHTAHRSIDLPRKEDDPEVQEMQAMALGFGQMFDATYFPMFQIHDHRGIYVYFHMRDDHPIIMQQAFELLQKIRVVHS